MLRDILLAIASLFSLVCIGSSLTACTSPQDEELVHISAAGDAGRVASLIKSGANVEGRAIDDWTPLAVAAKSGHLEVVKTLVSAGANVNSYEGGGNTPLFWAAYYGHVDVVSFLLAHGADPSKRRTGSLLPADAAEKQGHGDLAKLLREAPTEKAVR